MLICFLLYFGAPVDPAGVELMRAMRDAGLTPPLHECGNVAISLEAVRLYALGQRWFPWIGRSPTSFWTKKGTKRRW